MPPHKSTLKIIIEYDGQRLSLNCRPSMFGRWSIKNGRTPSKKRPEATITEIFSLARKWVVSTERQSRC